MAMTSASDLVDDVEARIAAGHLQPGDRLAPVRSTAVEIGLAPNTVASAYRQLRERGLVVGRGRQGTVVAHRRQVVAAPSAPLPVDLTDVRSGNPNPSLQPDLSRAIAAAAAGQPTSYGDRIVTAELAAAGRAWLAVDGIDATYLTVASGAMDAIERVLAEHVRIGDRVAIEDPGHAPIHDLVAALQLEPVLLPIDDEGITVAGLEAALDHGVRAIIVTPRAQNPTGAATTPERAAAIDAKLRTYPTTLVIEDDHAGPVAGVDLAGLDRDRQNWAVVRSVSKTLGADLRLAFIVGDERTVEQVEARLSIGPGWVSHLLQRIVAHLLGDPETAVVIEEAATQYRSRRERLINALADGGVSATGRSGLHVWIPVAAEQPVVDAVRDIGFAIRQGSPYRRLSSPAVRVTIASLNDEHVDLIAAAIVAAVHPETHRTRLS